eukprot:6604166-Prorocentrum_lima.AAC.1
MKPQLLQDVGTEKSFRHNDYDLQFDSQCFAELQCARVIAWTVGSGSPLLAAVDKNLPVLGVCLNRQH